MPSLSLVIISLLLKTNNLMAKCYNLLMVKTANFETEFDITFFWKSCIDN